MPSTEIAAAAPGRGWGRARRVAAAFVARNIEFVRDRTALGWNLVMPVLIVLGFAFGYSGEPAPQYKVGVLNDGAAHPAFLDTRHVQFVPYAEADTEAAITRVERHQLDLLIDLRTQHYWVNEESAKGYLAERLLAGSDGGSGFRREAVRGRVIRYVDWLIPGVLSMNMMWSALYGVGYVIVRYRKNGVLKRLKATPLSAVEFLAAQIGSRLTLVLLVSTLVFTGTHLLIGYPMYGSYLHLLLVFALGASSLIGIGLVIAARLRTEEMADGLLNLISWPMMFLSGIWFSLDGMHPWVQKLALIFPLTHVTTAARAVMIDGAGLATIAPQLGVLAGFTLVCLGIGAALFRWE
ncbi:MAG: ABC transporter permease [Proteobacteria bacterium]|nr:ABC transporter permease [Pseudomonadota bacterium]